MTRAIAVVVSVLALSATLAVAAPASAHPAQRGDTITYLVWADSADVEISTYDGFNRPVFANRLTPVPGRPGLYEGRYDFRVTATDPYLALGITSSGDTAGCEARINGTTYSSDYAHGYRPRALCN
ncbi:hypothetical protein BOWSER_38 [Gordonia phage Bowser]|uniref:Uncharacterized protein n=1 Tax=Gordonia phage Bowser TaxID=1838063 RepID=A0A161HSX6_9CAUD|nr:hypothetical protein BH770_gp38 [Gordonia phage Bowser]ANA85433.1 hypothetical protein BOWSER_38 [Gordonia phage Bowser]